jgi:hypothetical protein
LKQLFALEAKHEEIVKNHAMWALVNTPSHFGRGGKLGVVGRLMKFNASRP